MTEAQPAGPARRAADDERPARPGPGRPRSEQARRAVLHAVDDLLVDVGYAAMTMKGIAERAGVGRQTVYRWWSTKAEILLEAALTDARRDLATPHTGTPAGDLAAFLSALNRFLTVEPAGLSYLALVGEGQHDPRVRDLLRTADVLGRPTRAVLDRVRPHTPGMPADDLAQAQLTGPPLAAVLTGRAPLTPDQLQAHAATLLAAWTAAPSRA